MSGHTELGPILRSLRHHKGAFSLLVLEVAFGFVILVHALIAARYYHLMGAVHPGIPYDELVVVQRRFLQPRDVASARALQRADLSALAAVPGAQSAALDAPPLPDNAIFPIVTRADGHGEAKLAWTVRATANVVDALGLTRIAGPGFDAAAAPAEGPTPLLITRSMAVALFGQVDSALGRTIDAGDVASGRVAGVVEDFAFRGNWAPQAWSVVVAMAEPASEQGLTYVVHVPAGHRPETVAALQRLFAPGAPNGADSAVEVRPIRHDNVRYMRISSGAVIVLAWLGFLVVVVALAGSLALSSFSVAERTRQIGVRRALGARRGQIVRYFLLENLVLTGLGLVLGLVLATALNLVLRRLMADIVPTAGTVIASMAVFLVTGLLSALVPARRAAAIPPWAATRTL